MKLLRAAGWLVVGLLLGFVALRLVGAEAWSGLVYGVVAFTPLVLLPAWLALGAAAIVRDRALLAVAAALVVLQLVWLVPDGPWAGDPAELGEHEQVRLVVSNANDNNTTPEQLAEALLAEDPDVLVVLELTPRLAAALQAAGVREQLPSAIEDPRRGTTGSAIYARLPMSARTVLDVGGTPMTSATVTLGQTPTRLVAVHTTQPLVDVHALHQQLRGLAALVEQAPTPLVLAGDFNANSQVAGFRSILEAGSVDAHRATGRGWARSWPDSILAPMVLLDHVVVTPEVGVLATAERDGRGSDHRYLVVDLVAPTSSAPAAPAAAPE